MYYQRLIEKEIELKLRTSGGGSSRPEVLWQNNNLYVVSEKFCKVEYETSHCHGKNES